MVAWKLLYYLHCDVGSCARYGEQCMRSPFESGGSSGFQLKSAAMM